VKIAQSRFMSGVETAINIVIGFTIQSLANWFVLPWFGLHPSVTDVLGLGAVMTVISIVRSYGLRRLFEALKGRTAPPQFTPIVEEIARERLRQINGEGFDLAHDDEHSDGELACAGAAYAYASHLSPADRRRVLTFEDIPSDTNASVLRAIWPAGWSWHWLKLSHRRRDLIKAAALIVAEIGRIDRAKDRA
jgi:hypothetical protein